MPEVRESPLVVAPSNTPDAEKVNSAVGKSFASVSKWARSAMRAVVVASVIVAGSFVVGETSSAKEAHMKVAEALHTIDTLKSETPQRINELLSDVSLNCLHRDCKAESLRPRTDDEETIDLPSSQGEHSEIKDLLALSEIGVGVIEDHVYKIEINKFADEQGKGVFEQVIYCFGSEGDPEGYVVDWRLLKKHNQIPRRDWKQEHYKYVTIWHDGEVLRKVRSEYSDESNTQYDPELKDRDTLPKERRRLLGKMPIPPHPQRNTDDDVAPSPH